MDHDKKHKPAYHISQDMPSAWIDGFFNQVKKDWELKRLSEIMTAVARSPESVTISLTEKDRYK